MIARCGRVDAVKKNPVSQIIRCRSQYIKRFGGIFFGKERQKEEKSPPSFPSCVMGGAFFAFPKPVSETARVGKRLQLFAI